MKMEKEFKIPNRVICGICCADLGASDNPRGELGYDGCESHEGDFYHGR